MFYSFLWFFFLYAFLGWCCEVCFAAVKNGRFVNRGFLNGPWCPIYGFGVCIVVLFLEPLRGNLALLFLGSVVLTSLLELVTGFALERLFHQKWWDYSGLPLNIGGYICLLFSLLWGAACVFVVDVLHPGVARMVSAIPRPLGAALLGVLACAMAVDLAATVSTVLKLNQKLRRLDELAGRIKAASDELGEALSDGTLSLTEKHAAARGRLEEAKAQLSGRLAEREADIRQRHAAREKALQRRQAALRELKAANEELLATYHFGQKRLLKAFPNMISTRHREALEQMKQRLKDLKK